MLEAELDMNCIAETATPLLHMGRHCKRHTKWICTFVAHLMLLAGCEIPASESAIETRADHNLYRLELTVTPDRSRSGTLVEMKLSQSRGQLRQIRMPIDPERISDVRGGGGLQIDDDIVIWKPGEKGDSIQWFARLQHQRGDGGFDAYIESDWALFRAEDVIPRATTRTLKGATSETWLEFVLPVNWSSVTPYFGRDHRYRVDDPDRRFDLPGGWLALGQVGVRFDTIAGTRTKIAAPEGHGVRRLDMLALLNWTLPEVRRVMPDFPDRLTVVSAAAPMWRGGLSGPLSLYIHADRPLISENSTSTLLHEVFHVGFEPSAAPGADWIVEGLAEYYSIQFLVRSGSISSQRQDIAMKAQKRWGRGIEQLCVRRSSGSTTARAVTIFGDLDTEIRAATNKRYSLDDVVRALANNESKLTLSALRASVGNVMGKNSDTLAERNLPGCDK